MKNLKSAQKKTLKLLFAISFVCLNSCANLKEIDKPACTDLRPGAGFCVWMISNKEQEVDDKNLLVTESFPQGQTWYDLQVGIIKLPIDTFTSLKKYLIKKCKQYNDCDKMIDSWDRSLTTLENKAMGRDVVRWKDTE